MLKAKKAYSLVELSVVITIMSILMMGVASIVTNSMKKAQKNETQEKIQIIYNAMGKFLLREKRLPCPARLNLAESSASYGDETTKTGYNCNTVAGGIFTNGNNFFIGAVPTTTLGLSSDMAKDEFGNKITYIVSKNATIATTLEAVSPAIFPLSNIGFGATTYTNQILTVSEYSNRQITANAILALISHGNNKNCAYPANSTSANSSCPINDEATNSSNKYSAPINNSIIYSSTNPNFDDIVLFKTKNQIANDFNAHHLVLCDASATTPYNNYKRTAGGNVRNTSQILFYEQNLFHIDSNNSCQLICGKYGVLFLSKKDTQCTN
jgi:prepilin-type N-terminal cleavage/methylation domain-containing protein